MLGAVNDVAPCDDLDLASARCDRVDLLGLLSAKANGNTFLLSFSLKKEKKTICIGPKVMFAYFEHDPWKYVAHKCTCTYI